MVSLHLARLVKLLSLPEAMCVRCTAEDLSAVGARLGVSFRGGVRAAAGIGEQMGQTRVAIGLSVCVIFYLVSGYMRPEGPWQRLRCCRSSSGELFYDNRFPGTRPALPVIVKPGRSKANRWESASAFELFVIGRTYVDK